MWLFFYYLGEFKLKSEEIKFQTIEASQIIWEPVFRFGIKITNHDSKEGIAL